MATDTMATVFADLKPHEPLNQTVIDALDKIFAFRLIAEFETMTEKQLATELDVRGAAFGLPPETNVLSVARALLAFLRDKGYVTTPAAEAMSHGPDTEPESNLRQSRFFGFNVSPAVAGLSDVFRALVMAGITWVIAQLVAPGSTFLISSDNAVLKYGVSVVLALLFWVYWPYRYGSRSIKAYRKEKLKAVRFRLSSAIYTSLPVTLLACFVISLVTGQWGFVSLAWAFIGPGIAAAIFGDRFVAIYRTMSKLKSAADKSATSADATKATPAKPAKPTKPVRPAATSGRTRIETTKISAAPHPQASPNPTSNSEAQYRDLLLAHAVQRVGSMNGAVQLRRKIVVDVTPMNGSVSLDETIVLGSIRPMNGSISGVFYGPNTVTVGSMNGRDSSDHRVRTYRQLWELAQTYGLVED